MEDKGLDYDFEKQIKRIERAYKDLIYDDEEDDILEEVIENLEISMYEKDQLLEGEGKEGENINKRRKLIYNLDWI